MSLLSLPPTLSVSLALALSRLSTRSRSLAPLPVSCVFASLVLLSCCLRVRGAGQELGRQRVRISNKRILIPPGQVSGRSAAGGTRGWAMPSEIVPVPGRNRVDSRFPPLSSYFLFLFTLTSGESWDSLCTNWMKCIDYSESVQWSEGVGRGRQGAVSRQTMIAQRSTWGMQDKR